MSTGIITSISDDFINVKLNHDIMVSVFNSYENEFRLNKDNIYDFQALIGNVEHYHDISVFNDEFLYGGIELRFTVEEQLVVKEFENIIDPSSIILSYAR